MYVISDVTIMLHDDASIQDAIIADYGLRVHDNTGHDNSTGADMSRAGHNGRWMDQRCPVETLL